MKDSQILKERIVIKLKKSTKYIGMRYKWRHPVPGPKKVDPFLGEEQNGKKEQ